jgi:hypothetical protein
MFIEALRGTEAPLFHGTTRLSSSFSATLKAWADMSPGLLALGFLLAAFCTLN